MSRSGGDPGPQRGGGGSTRGGRPGSAGLPHPPDCETLIRRMLVVDPSKRITIAQIRQHRWMQAEPPVPRQACTAFSALSYNASPGRYDEQVLGIMHTLGIDRQRTVEVRATAWPRAGLDGRGAHSEETQALASRVKTGTWANLRASCPLL